MNGWWRPNAGAPMALYLRDDFKAALAAAEPAPDADVFGALMRVSGQVYRLGAGRRTVRFAVGGRDYFAKVHDGVGWREVLKNLAVFKRPVLGARDEFEACRHLAARGLLAPRVAAFGERGRNPARRRSFIVCDALEGYSSLEDIAAGPPLPPRRRRQLAGVVASTLGALHAAGVCHRDCYAGHFLVDNERWARGEATVAVIDLHRARVRAALPLRWRRRDLAALRYSTLAFGLTPRELRLFAAVYRARADHPSLDAGFWRGVSRRVDQLRRRRGRPALAADARTPSVTDFPALRATPPTPFRFDMAGVGVPLRVRCESVLRWRRGRGFSARARIGDETRLLVACFGAGRKRRIRRVRRRAEALAAIGVGPKLRAVGRGGRAEVLLLDAMDGRAPVASDLPLVLALLARMHDCGLRLGQPALDGLRVTGDRAWIADAAACAPGGWRQRAAERDLAVAFAALGPARLDEGLRCYLRARTHAARWPTQRARQRIRRYAERSGRSGRWSGGDG